MLNSANWQGPSLESASKTEQCDHGSDSPPPLLYSIISKLQVLLTHQRCEHEEVKITRSHLRICLSLHSLSLVCTQWIISLGIVLTYRLVSIKINNKPSTQRVCELVLYGKYRDTVFGCFASLSHLSPFPYSCLRESLLPLKNNQKYGIHLNS